MSLKHLALPIVAKGIYSGHFSPAVDSLLTRLHWGSVYQLYIYPRILPEVKLKSLMMHICIIIISC